MKAPGCDVVYPGSQSSIFDGHPPKFLRAQGDQQTISHADPSNNKEQNDMSTFDRSPSNDCQGWWRSRRVAVCRQLYGHRLQRYQQLARDLVTKYVYQPRCTLQHPHGINYHDLA
ncbi:hypothetical protein QAD02_013172 [Eretmocerus hayati]|uniref:Uncharacterized protein n=1 Tax=Eretmocerus hayati TaxID=131215 RepID=A0ACC2P6H6_9HYME|nr:hypothetical protein QAD02_013172 [Eretmocerus hayati]